MSIAAAQRLADEQWEGEGGQLAARGPVTAPDRALTVNVPLAIVVVLMTARRFLGLSDAQLRDLRTYLTAL